MKKYVYAVCFFAALLVGCATTKTSLPDPVPQLPTQTQEQTAKQELDKQMQEMDKRWVLANKWLAALEDVAENTKDAHAHKVLDMLTERGIIALPTESGLWIPNVVDDTDSIRIVVLTPSDAKYNVWKDFVTENAAADFVPRIRAIVIKDTGATSRVFQGIIFAHEASHALFFTEHPYNENRSDKEFCEDERDTHEFENRLLLKIGGNAYKRFLEKEIRRMPVEKSANGDLSFPYPGNYPQELDKIFSPALSDSEKQARGTGVWIDTVFHFIDRHYDGNKEEAKAEFLCETYVDQRILNGDKK